jgi:hypothetical protein
MDIKINFRELFTYDVTVLKDLIRTVDNSLWDQNTVRQRSFVRQQQTKSIIYVWTGMHDELYSRVQTIIPNSEDPLTKEVWTVAEQIRNLYGDGATIVRLMLVNLPANSEIGTHSDIKNLCLIHRNHLPIITNSNCNFVIDGTTNNFAEGVAVEINNQKLHSFSNTSNEDRIHLICDVLEKDTIENISNYVVHTAPWW